MTQDLLGWNVTRQEVEDSYWVLEATAVWAAARYYDHDNFPKEKKYWLDNPALYQWLFDSYAKWVRGAVAVAPKIAPGARAGQTPGMGLPPAAGYDKFPFWLYVAENHPAAFHEFLTKGAPRNIDTPIETSFMEHFGVSVERMVIDFLAAVVAGGFDHIAVVDLTGKGIAPPRFGKSDVVNLTPGMMWPAEFTSGHFAVAYIDEDVGDDHVSTLRACVSTIEGVNQMFYAVVADERAAEPNVIKPATLLNETDSIKIILKPAFLLMSGCQGFQNAQERLWESRPQFQWKYQFNTSRYRAPYQILLPDTYKCLEVNNGTSDEVQFWTRSQNPWAFWCDDEGVEDVN